MLKSILIGVDGSSFGTAAIELGIRWAQHSDTLLVGLGVVDQPTICGSEAVPLGGMAFKEHRDQTLLAEARQKVERAMQAFSSRCAAARVPCGSLEAIGLPAEEIMLEAQRYDLILLGQRTFFHSETQPDGDETLRNIVKHSPRPVVAVPETPRDGTTVVVAPTMAASRRRAPCRRSTASGFVVRRMFTWSVFIRIRQRRPVVRIGPLNTCDSTKSRLIPMPSELQKRRHARSWSAWTLWMQACWSWEPTARRR